MPVEWDVTDAAEPAGEHGTSGTVEELADAERRPRRPFVRWVLVAVLGVVVVAGVVLATHHRHSPRSPTAAATTPTPSPAVPPTETDSAIARIRDLALSPGPLPRYVRATVGGDCVPTRPGSSPPNRMATAVRRTLPGYRVTDVGFIVEATDALCAVQLRARDGRGDVLAVEVVAPARPADATSGHLLFGSRPDRAASVEYATGVLPGGWQVTVGAVGPARRLPGVDLLIGLAKSPAARW